MKKDLIIIPTSVKRNRFMKHFNRSCEVLALTPSAMLSLDILDVSYKTTEDFYKTETFRSDMRRLNEEIEKILCELDKVCEQLVGFPYSYTGNIYWFLCIFADLFYMERLSEIIQRKYDKIYLFSNAIPNNLLWSNLTYSERKYHTQATGIMKKIQILQNTLNSVLIPDGLQEYPSNLYFLKGKSYLKSMPYRLRKVIRQKGGHIFRRAQTLNSWNRKKRTIFVIQDGHEIGWIKKYMPEFNFVNPVASLNTTVTSLTPVKYDFNRVGSILAPFLEGKYPKLKICIQELFSSYHREVIGRLGYLKESFQELIDNHRPKMLLFSTGATEVTESLFAYVANQRGIPVIYFQHGGATIFSEHLYQKYLERNIKINKTLILNSKAEANEANHDGSDCVALGSILRYELTKKHSKSLNNKILYCCGPFPFHHYKDLHFNASDKQCYLRNHDIIEATKENLLSIDIKLHPVEQNYCFDYFTQLIREIKHTKARIIYGVPAESIMKSYGLLVIDYLASAITPIAIALKVPIILYLKDLSTANPSALEDLRKRCYIVHDREMLSEVLKKYASGKLPSKWSDDIVDRYVYPVKNGHPGANIANYIKSIYEGTNSK